MQLLFQLKVKDVMTHPVLTASPSDTMRHIQETMKKNRITGIPICAEDRELVGIVSMDDIINALVGGWIDEPAALHMTPHVMVLQETMPISFCVSFFNKYSFGRFPVVDRDSKLTGIVTASDVISTLLVALNREVARIEDMQSAQGPSAAAGGEAKPKGDRRVLEFKTEPFNFELAGQPSTEIKKILRADGVSPEITRRIGIASYELEINQVVHSEGGVMRYIVTPETLVIEAQDVGPGIPDIKKAMTEGFSTASDKVRALGFGAGMGLPNTKRVSDRFEISSDASTGTIVRASFNLKPQEEGSGDKDKESNGQPKDDKAQ